MLARHLFNISFGICEMNRLLDSVSVRIPGEDLTSRYSGTDRSEANVNTCLRILKERKQDGQTRYYSHISNEATSLINSLAQYGLITHQL